jgi:hypothetical protein
MAGEIQLSFPGHQTTAEVVKEKWDRLADWVLLQCKTAPDTRPLPLEDLRRSGDAWETFGFPDHEPTNGQVFQGDVTNHKHDLEGHQAFQLFSKQAAAGSGSPVNGLSGAPVVVENAAVGHVCSGPIEPGYLGKVPVNKSIGGTLYACPAGSVVKASAELLRLRPVYTVDYQEDLLRQLRQHFVGRREEISRIEAVIADPGAPRHILIEAPAGYGKSTLIAKLVDLHPDFLCYLVREEDQHHTATALLERLCTQLARRLGSDKSYAGSSLPVLEEEFERLRRRVLERLEPGKQLVIAIDGLDETSRRRNETLLRPHYYRTDHPALCYLLSFRSGTLEPKTDLGLNRFESILLQGLQKGDVADLFVVLNRSDLAKRKELLTTLVRRTAGEPFYLRFLVEDLAAVDGPVTIPTDLPADSRDYIARQVKGIAGEKLLELIPEEIQSSALEAAEVASLILRTLAVAQDWLRREDLLTMLQQRLILVRTLIRELRRYFVTDRPRDLSPERYLIMPLKLREAVRQAYLADELREAEEKLLTYCRDWNKHQAPYAYHFLTHHLAALNQYQELLQTLEGPFLKAKSQKFRAHGTLADLDRGLRMGLDQRDSLKVIRMLLLMSQTRHAIEQRAMHGGIALDASHGHYDVAVGSARALPDAESRFWQFLVIAETSLQKGSYQSGINLLDEALELEIQLEGRRREDFDPLFDLLLIRYRDIDRALKLAAKCGVKADGFLKRAFLRIVGEASDYAVLLADRIQEPYIWRDAHLEASRTMLRQQPDLARRLLTIVIQKARADNNLDYLLDTVPLLRELDKPQAAALVDEVLTRSEAERKADPDARPPVERFNRAVVELGRTDFHRAWELALNRCRTIDDSSWAKSNVLAHLLNLATDSGHYLDRASLQTAMDSEREQRGDLAAMHFDSFLSALAVQFAAAAWDKTTQQLYDQIQVDRHQIRAATAIRLRLVQPACPTDVVKDALSAAKPDELAWEYDQVLPAARTWFKAIPETARQVFISVPNVPISFALLCAILGALPEGNADLLQDCKAVIARMVSDSDRARARISLAEAILVWERRLAVHLLEQALPEIATMSQEHDRSTHYGSVIQLALRLGKTSLVHEASRRHVRDLISDDPNGDWRYDQLRELVRWLLREPVELDRETMTAIMNGLSDPLAKGRLVGHWQGAEGYVNDQLRRSNLALTDFLTPLIVTAATEHDLGAIRRIRELVPESLNRALLLTPGVVALFPQDPGTGSQLFDEAWRILDQVMSWRYTSKATYDQCEACRCELLIALATVDVDEAIRRAGQLTSRNKRRVFTAIATTAARDLPRTEKVFGLARQAAREEAELADRQQALWELGDHAQELQPAFASDCRRESLEQLPAMKPRERVCAHLRCIAAGRGPDKYIESIWDHLFRDLKEVSWTIPAVETIFSAANQVGDRRLAQMVWMNIITVRLKAGELWNRVRELAQATFKMVRIGAGQEVQSVLTYLTHVLNRQNEEDQRDPETLAWLACAYHMLDHHDTQNLLDRLFNNLRWRLHQPRNWAEPIVQSLAVLAREYPNVVQKPSVWNPMLEIGATIEDLRYRANGQLVFIKAATDAKDFEKAITLLEQMPSGSARIQAARLVDDAWPCELSGNEGSGYRSEWKRFLDIASENVETLLRCATYWVKQYLKGHKSPEAVPAALKKVLEEVDSSIDGDSAKDGTSSQRW